MFVSARAFFARFIVIRDGTAEHGRFVDEPADRRERTMAHRRKLLFSNGCGMDFNDAAICASGESVFDKSSKTRAFAFDG